MERKKSPYVSSPLSDHLVPTDGSPTVAVTISVCEEPKGASCSPRDAMDQAWDNPWVDLGGEG